MAVTYELPVIDLAKFDAADREKLAAAGCELGCFRVIIHGLSARLQEEMRATARSLFDIPSATKLRNEYDEKNINGGGYLPRHSLGPYFESFGIFDATYLSDVQELCSSIGASPPQREIICEYVARLHDVMVKVSRRLAESLGLVGIDGCSFDEWLCHMRLNHYNFSGNKEEEDDCYHEDRTLALRAHTDSAFLTIVQEENTDIGGGMQIMKDGKFVAVDHPPPPGTFLINIGDTGKAWSNGRLRSVEHRVVRKELAPERTALSMFMLAPKNGWVEPHAAFVDSENPRLYKSFEYMKYRKLRKASGSLNVQLPRSKYRLHHIYVCFQ